MTSPSPDEVTQLLLDWSSGDKAALDKLMPLVYEELRRLAHHYMGRERPGHTLQTTAIVNEAYLHLIDQRKSQIVEMRFFGGMSIEETAEVLGVSPGTVMRDWTMAKAWLRREIGKEGQDES